MTPSNLEDSFIFVNPEEKVRGTISQSTEVSEGNNEPKREMDYKPTTLRHASLQENYLPGTSSPSYAHDWSEAGVGGGIRIHGRHLVDAYGRVCNLRGVNLSGSCKTPANGDHETFPANHQSVTFVGRPFPLEEAPEHFARLRRWGLTFIRFLVTWEAIEHEAPGVYDTEYLQYVHDLLSLLPNYGLVAFVSMHQDVWSRYCGGSGAPAWTLEAAGFDLSALEESGAAWLGGVKGGGHVEDEKGLWPTGYTKLAAATMATLFWAGDTFAPKLLVKNAKGEEVSIQQFLQNVFLEAYGLLAKAVGGLDGVIGFEMLNEPHPGFINLKSMHSHDYNTELHLLHVPSAFQSFQLGAGHPTSVSTWTRSFPMPTRHTKTTVLNQTGRKAWLADGPTKGQCLWAMHDVWGWDDTKNEAVILRENYFVKNPQNGTKIDWYTDFYYPFLRMWEGRVRNVSPPHKLIFTEALPNEFCPPSWTPENRPNNMVYAPHWYDLNALFAKAFKDFTVNIQGLSRGMFPLRSFYWGHVGARDNYSLQIRNIVNRAYEVLGEKPVIIGECGVPMDMNERQAFKTDDFTWQSRMMDAMITALERSLVGFTLWNYNPYNDDRRGDDWNGENFSWFSRKRALPPSLLYYEQDAPSLDNGARILPAIVRPYAAKTAGIPIRSEYEMLTGTFIFEWCTPQTAGGKPGRTSHPTAASPPLSGHPEITTRETEIYLPLVITQGRKVVVTGLEKGDSFVYDRARQTLFIVTRNQQPGKKHQVQVSLNPPLRQAFPLNDVWTDYGGKIFSFSMVVLGIIAYILFA